MSVRIPFLRCIPALKTLISSPPPALDCIIAWSARPISAETVNSPGAPQGEPEAHRAADFFAAEVDRFAGGAAKPFGHRGRRRFIGPAGHHQDEFVPTQSTQQVVCADDFLQASGQRSQIFVAGRVAEETVDRLQSVHVHEDDCDRPGEPALHPTRQMTDQSAAIRQPGEFVVKCQVEQTLLGGHPGVDLTEQRGHRPQRVDLRVEPLPVAVLDETQHTDRAVRVQQRNSGRGDPRPRFPSLGGPGPGSPRQRRRVG